MHPDYTPAAARALDAAQHWARQPGADAVQPLHLLLGLLAEEEGRVAQLLEAAGLDVASARQTLAAALAPGPQKPAENPLPMSPACHEMLDHAGDLAGRYDDSLSTEQLLAALLQLDTGLRQRLERLGMSWHTFAAAFQAEQRRPEQPVPIEEPLRLLETTERMDSARIVDACANRAREGLRVVEDYCRFVLDDAFLSGELKQLRHQLADVLGRLDPHHESLLAARDTLRDVGTSLTTPDEHARPSLLAVVQANLKRLQEALRTLEEFGKLFGPDVSGALEKARYRSYTLERAIMLGTSARRRLADVKLYLLLSGKGCAAALDWTIEEAAAGGVQMVQLREKDLPDRELLERARNVRRWTAQAGLLFIMNDRPDLARLIEADGIHLGQDDMPVREARRIAGPDAIIGVSTHNPEQVRQAVLDGASYIGIGPTFRSGTKEFGELAGLEFVKQATAETSLPAFVIGGVTAQNIDQAVQAGARRVAVSAAICQADEPRIAASTLRAALASVGA